MKDYTIGFSDSNYEKICEEFILKYEIVNENKLIKVYYANGKHSLIKYDSEDEKKILKKMKQQVFDYQEKVLKKIEVTKENNENDKKSLILSSALAFLGICFLLTGEDKARTLGFFLTILGSSITIIDFRSKWREYLILNDFKKNLMFIENEDLINKVLSKDSEITLKFTNSMMKGLVIKDRNIYIYTINSIEQISYGDLIKMLEIIKKEKVLVKKNKFN